MNYIFTYMKYFWIKRGFTSFGIKYTALWRVLEFWFDMQRIFLILKCIKDTFLKWVSKCFMVDMLWYLRDTKKLPLKSKECRRKGSKVAYKKLGALMRYYWIYINKCSKNLVGYRFSNAGISRNYWHKYRTVLNSFLIINRSSGNEKCIQYYNL